MREEGEDTMDNDNDRAIIFDQVERHLAETEAPFDVEAGLGRLRQWMAEPAEPDAPRKVAFMDYRTQDGLADYRLRVAALREVTGRHEEVDQVEEGAVRAVVRVFLLDDHEVARRGLRELLEASGGIEVVGEAARADEALRRIPAVRPDVAVLDARLPDGSGIEVCREIRSSLPSVACLILTSSYDDEALFAAIMAGAAGYVLKQIRGTDLIDAVHRVAQGQSLLDPAITANVLTRLREGPPATEPRLAALTDRERAVLSLIADGLSNREIGARLYLAEKTVKNHVSRLLAKLQMQRRTQVAVFGATMRDQGALRPQHPDS